VIITEDAYMEHHGVKGQKWGVRKDRAVRVSKAVGRGSKKTAIVVGRGARGTFRFARDNPETAAKIVAGVAAAGLILKANRGMKARTIRKEDYKAAAKLLEANKTRRLSDLGGIATRSKQGGVIRNLAVKEMAVTRTNHDAALTALAKNLKVRR